MDGGLFAESGGGHHTVDGVAGARVDLRGRKPRLREHLDVVIGGLVEVLAEIVVRQVAVLPDNGQARVLVAQRLADEQRAARQERLVRFGEEQLASRVPSGGAKWFFEGERLNDGFQATDELDGPGPHRRYTEPAAAKRRRAAGVPHSRKSLG